MTEVDCVKAALLVDVDSDKKNHSPQLYRSKHHGESELFILGAPTGGM